MTPGCAPPTIRIQRAIRHAMELPNLYLETSWCAWRDVLSFLKLVGAGG